MTIAAVTRTRNIHPSMSDRDRQIALELTERMRATDGCESLALLTDGTEGLVVSFWKDRASYDGWAKVRPDAVEKAAQGTGIIADPARLYEVDYWK